MAEAKSSFNIKKGNVNSFYHIFRHKDHQAKTIVEKYSDNNIYINDGKSVETMLMDWANDFNAYKEATKSKSGSKIKKENSLMEIIVNVKSDTTEEDLKKVMKLYEDRLGIKFYGAAFHKDEGTRAENDPNEIIDINEHAHLIGFTINDNKQTFRRQHITPKVLRELQTETSKILGMERGTPSNAKNDYRAYGAQKERERELLKENEELKNQLELSEYKFKDYQKRISELEAPKEDKKELHKLNTATRTNNSKQVELELKIQSMEKAATAQTTRFGQVLLDISSKYIDVSTKPEDLEYISELNEKLNLQMEDKINSKKDKIKTTTEMNKTFEDISICKICDKSPCQCGSVGDR